MLYHLLSLLVIYGPHRPRQTTPTNFTEPVKFPHMHSLDILNVNDTLHWTMLLT